MKELEVLINNIDCIPEVENCSKSKSYFRQYVMSANFFLVVIIIGLSHGHTSILLYQINPMTMTTAKNIRQENGEIFGKQDMVIESTELQSWITSVLVLFCFPGCWILAISRKNIGRKPILIGFVALYTVAWILVAFANSAYHLIIGRSIMSLCTGLLAGLTPVYQGECSEPKLRSFFNAMKGVAISIGILSSHAIGTWFHWRTTALFCGFISLITCGFNLTLPESPIWLLNKGRYLESIHSWTFIRGTRDFDELKSMLVYCERKSDSEEYFHDKQHSWINRFDTPGFLKPLGIMIVVFSVTQFSGVGAVTFYCMQMITQIHGQQNAYVTTLILDVIRFLSSIGLATLSTKYSTRSILLLSAFSCSIFLLTLSISVFLEIGTPWFPLILLFGYEIAVILGLFPLPWTFLSELFSTTHKEVGVGISTSYYYMLFFIVVKINLQMFELLQTWGTFLVFGLLTLGGSIILYVILPNTKNKSLKEIELMFTNGYKT